ncbi:zeta toxin family protein [Rhizobium sp. NFR12]|uniref:zeta toxin family protein n=1 Tax=Rhizobium sp. NFR12 TaxID=1566261 RepID=UPI0008A7FC91|nr:zeta toxin family protein [Rhizobium sp. NFR12]SEH31036.1 Predicted ABC-type ATPase [Rhizobium sp. NFR12]
MSKPVCTIMAGPNGSGKSSIYAKYRPPGDFINADEIQKGLPQDAKEGTKRVSAGRLAIYRIDAAIAAKTDFVFETTLSSEHSVGVMERAREAGFHVYLIFVCLDNAEENVKRVRFRVADGGHDIPSDTIIRRYEKSFENLPRALLLADEAALIDNTLKKPVLVVGMIDGKIEQVHYEQSALHDRLLDIADEVEEGRSVPSTPGGIGP